MLLTVAEKILHGEGGHPLIGAVTDGGNGTMFKLQQGHDALYVVAADESVIQAQFIPLLIQMHGAGHGEIDGGTQLKKGEGILST